MEAVMCENNALNRYPTRVLRVITPSEAWNGRKSMVSHMHSYLAYGVSSQHQKLDKMALNIVVTIKVFYYNID